MRGMIVSSLVLAVMCCGCSHRLTTCATNIVSATVVATYCSHPAGDDESLDLLILWRGKPGWFQRSNQGESGTRGSSTIGAQTNRRISNYSTYNGVTIGFDADFDAGTVTIGDTQLRLDDVSTVFVDKVDSPTGRHLAGGPHIVTTVKSRVDPNLVVIERSDALVRYLQCEIPMPRVQTSQTPVITVCEKLAAKRR